MILIARNVWTKSNCFKRPEWKCDSLQSEIMWCFLVIWQCLFLVVGLADHRWASFLRLPSEDSSIGAVSAGVLWCPIEAVLPDRDQDGNTWGTEKEPCTGNTWGTVEGAIAATSTRWSSTTVWILNITFISHTNQICIQK